MQSDAIDRQLDREGCWMRSLLLATLDRFIRNEPGVAAAPAVAATRVSPARNVGFVGVRHTEREPIERRLSFEREMKNVFVAVVQVARGIDRLEMSARCFFAVVIWKRD